MKRLIIILAGLLLLISGCAPKQAPVKVTVYFTNLNRYAVGTEPYEERGHPYGTSDRFPA